MKRFSFAAIAFTAALFVPAFAGEPAVTVSGLAPMNAGGYQVKAVNIAYGDLDITTSQGAAKLLDRIAMAARAVCGEHSGMLRNAERVKEFAACQARATATAVNAIGAPALVAATH